MSSKSNMKAPNKITKPTTNLRTPSTGPAGKRVNKKAVSAAVCLVAIVVFGAVIAGFGSSKTFVYANSVQGFGVGIYWDRACTNRTLSLNWGLMEAGSNSTLTVYIKNESNAPASLTVETSNWKPSAALGYMSLNWNYSGQVLSAGQASPLQLTLTVDPAVSGITNFSFDTTITTSER